jgi:hypothetical protein
LALASQLEAFLQKHPFASARVITQHVFTTVPTAKDIFQRELGMKKFSRNSVRHFVSDGQKGNRVEALQEMLRIL